MHSNIPRYTHFATISSKWQLTHKNTNRNGCWSATMNQIDRLWIELTNLVDYFFVQTVVIEQSSINAHMLVLNGVEYVDEIFYLSIQQKHSTPSNSWQAKIILISPYQTERQTNSFIENSIEAGILPGTISMRFCGSLQKPKKPPWCQNPHLMTPQHKGICPFMRTNERSSAIRMKDWLHSVRIWTFTCYLYIIEPQRQIHMSLQAVDGAHR